MSANATLFDAKDVGHQRSKLQPLSSADLVTNSREKWLASIGTIDPYLVVAKRVDSPSFYIVHRPNGQAVFVTSGLWDPNATVMPSTSTVPAATAVPPGGDAEAASGMPDIELLAEARESELGSDLSNCWLFQCLLEVACTAKRNYNKVRRLLKERQYATMEVNTRVRSPHNNLSLIHLSFVERVVCRVYVYVVMQGAGRAHMFTAGVRRSHDGTSLYVARYRFGRLDPETVRSTSQHGYRRSGGDGATAHPQSMA